MKSSKSSPKRTVKSYFEEISPFDLYHQLIYMSATSAAGVSRARVFELARSLPNPSAQYFKKIHEVAENLRYNYPDAVRLVGEKAKSEDVRTFLLRFSDALRSGEPLPGFLAREADIQGQNYGNDYLRRIESLKKWTDAYASVAVSVSLIVIINMVMTMIYNVGPGMMAGLIFVAVSAAFGVAWVLFRASPQEDKSVPLAIGSKEQRRSRKWLLLTLPVLAGLYGVCTFLKVNPAWSLIAGGILFLPVGWVAQRADTRVSANDTEISAFLRSIGGTATSRGTTIKEALAAIRLDSFPALQPDIRLLDLRLKSYGNPLLCWRTFGFDTGSKLADQSIGIFYEAVNLGGDPERVGNLTSEFAMKTAMLRAQRRGVAATFAWLTIIMHTIMAGLMIFLLGILGQFALRLNAAMSGLQQGGSSSPASLGLGNMFSFSTAQVTFLSDITVMLLVVLAVVNAFAVVASEGAHLIKITWYLGILLICSGVCFLIVPPLVKFAF